MMKQGMHSGRRTSGGRSSSGGRYGSSERSSGGGRSGARGYGSREGGQEPRERFFRKKVCRFCTDRANTIDFKDTEKLTRFLTEKGKILPQRITGNCSVHQRILAKAVKRCRHASLIAFQIS